MPNSSMAEPSAKKHMFITSKIGCVVSTQPPAVAVFPNVPAPPRPVLQLYAPGFSLGVSGTAGPTFER
jgi:hypothetical protein